MQAYETYALHEIVKLSKLSYFTFYSCILKFFKQNRLKQKWGTGKTNSLLQKTSRNSCTHLIFKICFCSFGILTRTGSLKNHKNGQSEIRDDSGNILANSAWFMLIWFECLFGTVGFWATYLISRANKGFWLEVFINIK